MLALQEAYPEYSFEPIYVLDHLKRSPLTLAIALAVGVATYWPDLLHRRKAVKYAVFRTSWMFRRIKRLAATLVDQKDYAFTFQMQSLFDASVPSLPHFVYTDHTHLENLNYQGPGATNLYAASWIDCERSVYRNATRVFTRSSNVTASLEKKYDCPPDRVACVYAGSNAAIPEAVPPDPERYARKRILFAGVDWQRKGGPTVLAAFAKVLERHPDAQLTIVGCNPDIGDLRNVEVLGRVPLDQMPEHFAGASVFCLPTWVEPFGIVFVEAMWQRLPIVATRVGALPDMVEDDVNGYLVSPGDAAALADRLSRLLDDPKRCAAFGEAGLALARDRYDWNAVAGRMRREIDAALDRQAAVNG